MLDATATCTISSETNMAKKLDADVQVQRCIA